MLAITLAGATGCAQLAGIDETSGVVVPEERVSLSFDRLSIGASLVRSPMDLTDQRATYLVPDDTAADGLSRIPAEVGPTDTWSAVIETGSPPILFELPDYPTTIPRLWDLPNRNLRGEFAVMEHPSPVPAPAGATLTVQATLPTAYAATERFVLYTVGTWTDRRFSGVGEVPAVDATVFGPVSIAYDSTTKITGRPHEQITSSDAVLLLRYVGNRLTGVMEAPPFDQTGTDMVMGAMTAVPTTETLEVTLMPNAVAARYAPARPAMGNVTMQWTLTAAPGVTVGNTNGPGLHAATVVPTAPGMISVAYANPFATRGWNTVLTWSTSADRSYTPAGQTLPATLSAGLYQAVEPTAGMTLDLPAALPEVITLDARALSSDGMTILMPTRPLVASFVAGSATTTLYQLQLFELVPNAANTALEYKSVVAASGVRPEFSFPPELFAPGKHYTLRAVTISGGFPALADGDLGNRSLPIAIGYHDSGVFTVRP